MAPKKKGGKKQQEEDWEAELGEAAPAGEEPQDPANGDAEANGDGDGDEVGGGGLLAALKKNRSKKAKKGKNVDNDWVEGEDPTKADANGDAAVDLASKAPQEGSFEDEDDVFSGKPKKPASKAQTKKDEEEEDGGKLKSKKEKEKEKKEREKQRKKEQVRQPAVVIDDLLALLTAVITSRLQRKKALHPLLLRNQSQPSPSLRSKLCQLPNQPNRQSRLVRRRSFHLTSLPSRNSKKL
jgi:hypothetical protein